VLRPGLHKFDVGDGTTRVLFELTRPNKTRRVWLSLDIGRGSYFSLVRVDLSFRLFS
jgi:hypothetical protein